MKKYTRNLISIVIAISLLKLLSSPVFAVEISSFPTCANPTGTLHVDYPTGIHGIAGNSAQFSGSDKVYLLGNGNAMQCFCPTSGDAIQTNWQKADSFTDEEIKVLESQGWIYIPNGALWGLSQGAYVAQNINFSCTSQNNSNNNNNNNNTGGNAGSSSSSPTQSVLGAATSMITTLAFTGNVVIIYILLSFGILFSAIGLLLPKNRK